MIDGGRPDLRPAPTRPGRRPGQWVGLAVVAAGMAAATVVVPPLIAPDRKDHGAAGPTSTGPASPSATTGQPAVMASVPGQFTQISIQAEDPANTLTGGASTVACSTCRGGKRVRYLCATCAVEVRTTLPTAGSRTITVYYEVDGPRKLKVKINGASPRSYPVDGPEWTVPQSFKFTADLPAGELRLTLYNDDSPAPDVDEIVIA